MDAKSAICPTCGGIIAHEAFNFDANTRTFVANGREVLLTPGEARVLGALWQARRRGGFDNLEALADAVWRDDPDGGPDSDRVSLSVMLARLRRKLDRVGCTIPYGSRGRPKRNFRIINLEQHP